MKQAVKLNEPKLMKRLSVLLRSGIPLVKALKVCGFPVQAIDRVSSGNPLHGALGGFFSQHSLALIRIGEHSGAVEKMLDAAADDILRQKKVIEDIMKSLFYPMAVLAMVFASMILFTFFIMPQFSGLFTQMGLHIPQGLTTGQTAAKAFIFAFICSWINLKLFFCHSIK